MVMKGLMQEESTSIRRGIKRDCMESDTQHIRPERGIILMGENELLGTEIRGGLRTFKTAI